MAFYTCAVRLVPGVPVAALLTTKEVLAPSFMYFYMELSRILTVACTCLPP